MGIPATARSRYVHASPAAGLRQQLGAAVASLAARADALLSHTPSRTRPGRKRLNLALQGGGAHGAFTWGVLDRLLEEPDLEIVGISGTSAGAMNAVVTADGLARGGRHGARDALEAFWHDVADAARRSVLTPTTLERALGLAEAGLYAGRFWLEGLSRLASPYTLNPNGLNPLREVLAASVDFERLHREAPVRLFVCATDVRGGKPRVFGPDEIGLEPVLASAALPTLFHPVEIDGETYWDGGYVSNPPILPLVEGTDCDDILIVQVDPLRLAEAPTSAEDIRYRVQTLGFNAGFVSEMHALAALGRIAPTTPAPRPGGRGSLARRLLGLLRRPEPRQVRMHLVEAEAEMAELKPATKLDPDEAFLDRLFVLGRERAEGFLEESKEAIGVRSSLDVAARFL